MQNLIKIILICSWICIAIIGYNGFFLPHKILTVSSTKFLPVEEWVHISLASLYFTIPIILLFVSWNLKLRRLLFFICLATYVVSVGLDLSRMQPYMLIYFCLFSIFIFYRDHSIIRDLYLLICISGVYFYSGFFKFNTIFADYTAKIFWFDIFPFPYQPAFGYLFAAVEVLISGSLFIRGSRKVAIIAAIFMHLLLLWKLGPAGLNYNIIVWPWNLFMVALLFYLFTSTVTIKSKNIVQKKLQFATIYICFFWIFPAFSFTGYYPTVLSFSMYSSYIDGPYLIDNNLVEKQNDPPCIGILSYSMKERGITYYPAHRLFDSVVIRYNKEHHTNYKLTRNQEICSEILPKFDH